MPTDELAAAINMLDDILQLRRKPSPAAENTEARADVQRVIDSLGAPEALPHAIPSTGMQAPPPPAAPLPPATIPAPPAVMLATDENGDDIEVETDEGGNVTALTTSVQLPAAAPPAPPAPVAAAPSAGIPAATPLPPGPIVAAELDSRGYPWDGRIHAANRSQTIKKEWKLKRGVDANLVVACEAQNKPGKAPSPAATATIADGSTATAPSAVAVAVPAVATAPSAPPPPPASLPVGSAAPTAVVPSAIDFRGLMQKIQAATAAKKLTDAQVNAALLTVGLQPTDMAQLIGNALYIASVNAAIDACLAS